MRVLNDMPSNSFLETGFYLSHRSKAKWRYTGKYGLVKNGPEMENKSLPQPYGYGPESVLNSIIELPLTLLTQLYETGRYFIDNTFYFDSNYSIKNDFMLIPYALADFIPALFTTIAALLAPVWLVLLAISEASQSKCFAGILIPLCIIFSPVISAAGALFGAWELVAATLMFAKAGAEVGFAAISIALSPIKAIVAALKDDTDECLDENGSINPYH